MKRNVCVCVCAIHARVPARQIIIIVVTKIPNRFPIVLAVKLYDNFYDIEKKKKKLKKQKKKNPRRGSRPART